MLNALVWSHRLKTSQEYRCFRDGQHWRSGEHRHRCRGRRGSLYEWEWNRELLENLPVKLSHWFFLYLSFEFWFLVFSPFFSSVCLFVFMFIYVLVCLFIDVCLFMFVCLCLFVYWFVFVLPVCVFVYRNASFLFIVFFYFWSIGEWIDQQKSNSLE